MYESITVNLAQPVLVTELLKDQANAQRCF